MQCPNLQTPIQVSTIFPLIFFLISRGHIFITRFRTLVFCLPLPVTTPEVTLLRLRVCTVVKENENFGTYSVRKKTDILWSSYFFVILIWKYIHLAQPPGGWPVPKSPEGLGGRATQRAARQARKPSHERPISLFTKLLPVNDLKIWLSSTNVESGYMYQWRAPLQPCFRFRSGDNFEWRRGIISLSLSLSLSLSHLTFDWVAFPRTTHGWQLAGNNFFWNGGILKIWRKIAERVYF